MKAKTLRVSLLIFIMSIIGAFFQNCSPPVNFTATDPALLSSSGAISGQPQLPCSDGQPDGTVRWDVVVGQIFTTPALSCPNGGNLTDVFAKLEKFICTNGQYISANEFKNGTQLPSTGGCDCAGGLANGMSSVAKANTSDPQTCSPGTGTIVSNYEESTTKLCNNGTIETTTSKILLNQSGTCTCESGTAAGSIVSKTISTNNIEKQFCQYGGDLTITYDLSQKYQCSAAYVLEPQELPIQINPVTTGSCNPPPLKTEDLVIDQIKTTEPLDMIWVIDNSVSMSEEAAQVRNNLEKFVTSLNVSSDSNMKFLLVSTTKSTVTQTAKYCFKYPKDQGCLERAVSLPTDLGSNFIQESIDVGSNDAPSLLISVLKYSANGTTFFRDGSKKVIVFVSDDNSRIGYTYKPNPKVESITAVDFTTALKGLPNVKDGENSIFGFTGLGIKASPCQETVNRLNNTTPYDGTGQVYKNLAAATKGAVYNICDTDWSTHFAALKANVQTILGRIYTLKNPASNVAKIVISTNGVSTTYEGAINFTFDPATSKLTLKDPVIFTADSTITVYYN